MTPATASEPYKVELPPFKISTLSITSIGIAEILYSPEISEASFTGIPSISMRVLAALAPLIYTAFTSAGLLPFPPIVIPAILFKTSGKVLPWLLARVSAEITLTTLPISDIFFGERLAVTTTSSRSATGLCCARALLLSNASCASPRQAAT